MHIEVEIQHEEIIVSPRGAYTFHEQPGYLYTFDRSGRKAQYPTPCKISHKENAQPLKKGMYRLKPESIYVNRFGQISIFPILEPVTPAGVQPVKTAA